MISVYYTLLEEGCINHRKMANRVVDRDSLEKNKRWFLLGGDIQIMRSVMLLLKAEDLKEDLQKRLSMNMDRLGRLREEVLNNYYTEKNLEQADLEGDAIYQEYTKIVEERDGGNKSQCEMSG